LLGITIGNRVFAIIANLAGVSRLTLHRARDSGHVSEDLCEVLTPLILQFEAGKLRFRRTGPRSSYPNHWEIVER
jgi:hypothetical protein